MKAMTIVRVVAVLAIAISAVAIVSCSSETSHARRSSKESWFNPNATGYYSYPPGSGRLAAQSSAIPRIPGPIDEVWVVAKPPSANATRAAADPSVSDATRRDFDLDQPAASIKTADPAAPSIGSLVSTDQGSDGLPTRAFPLERTAVDAHITGPVASVEVAQTFRNPYSDTIEAAYVFPLPHDGAVSDFVLRIGDRMIRGIVREREEAAQIYRDARSAGYVASLLTEERPNIFMERVANIEPGATIEVTLTYFNLIDYADGWYEWRLPLVVGPRFNPPGTRNAIAAVGVGGSSASGQRTSVEYLPPGERTNHGVHIDFAIDAGVPIHEVQSPSHQIAWAPPEPSRASGRFVGTEEAMDRDFIVRYRVAGEEPQVGLVSSRGSGEEGYFALTVYPPQSRRELRRAPIDLVFIIDRSGSMDGQPLEFVKEAMYTSLARLRPGDRFQVVDFGNEGRAFGSAMMPVDALSIADAQRYVAALSAGGGTMVMSGLNTALALPSDGGRVRYLAFLTDGFVGNETEIIGALHRSLAGRRVFAFGIGSSVNWFLLSAMARAGNGAAAEVSRSSDARQTMNAFMDRISFPIVHDASLSFEGIEVDGMWPRQVPDLIVGKPVTVFGRYRGGGAARVALHAWSGAERVERSWNLEFARERRSSALDRMWARAQVAQLSDDATWQTGRSEQIRGDILATALRFGITSPYTSFIAVDGSRVTSGTNRRTIMQPVPMPEGVKYETTVDGRGH